LVNALEFFEIEGQMVTLTNPQDGALIIWLWVLVFGCLLLILIRRHQGHSTQTESLSHLKLTCQRELSIMQCSYYAKFSVGCFNINFYFVWHCPSKKPKKSSIVS
jgi:hypothetical protein